MPIKEIIQQRGTAYLPLGVTPITVKAGLTEDIIIVPPVPYLIENQKQAVLPKGGYVTLQLPPASRNYILINGNFTVPSVPAERVSGTKTSSFISDFATTVRNTVLSGLNTALTGAITATDTILQAFGKIQNQITSLTNSGLTYHKFTTTFGTNSYTSSSISNKYVVLATLDSAVIIPTLNFTKDYASDTFEWVDANVPLESNQTITLILNSTNPSS